MSVNTEKRMRNVAPNCREDGLAVLAVAGLAVASLAALVAPAATFDGLTFHNYIGRIAAIVTALAMALGSLRKPLSLRSLLTAAAIALVLFVGGSLVLFDGMLQDAAIAICELAGMAGDVAEAILAVFFLAALAQYPVRISGPGIPLALAASHGLFLATLAVPAALLGIIKFMSLLAALGMGLLYVCNTPASSSGKDNAPVAEDVQPSIQTQMSALPWRELLPLLAGTALFPLLFVFIAHMSDVAGVHASMFAPSVEISTIAALLVLALASRLMKHGVSMGMTFLIPMPFFVTAMTLLPLFWGTELFVFGIAIKCGYLLYNALLWMMVAKLCQGSWQRSVGLFALVTASTEFFALVGRNVAVGMLDFGLAERDVVIYVALAAVWLLSMGLIVFFLLDRRREKATADKTGVVPADSAYDTAPEVADDEESDPFKRKCTCCAERFGLSERESEIMAEFARGRSADYLAKQLFISKETVKTHLKRIYAKCGVHSRQELLDTIESCEE